MTRYDKSNLEKLGQEPPEIRLLYLRLEISELSEKIRDYAYLTKYHVDPSYKLPLKDSNQIVEWVDSIIKASHNLDALIEVLTK